MTVLFQTGIRGWHDYEPFRARSGANGDAEAAFFGILRYTTNDGGPPIYKAGGREVAVGQLMRRGMRRNGVTTEWEPDGTPWLPFDGSYETLRNSEEARAQARQTTAAGQNMKTPAGLLIVDGAGNTIPQPASGQPARDQWTGALTGQVVP